MTVTLASDQNPGSAQLSPTSQKILALRETVLKEWQTRVRAAIGQARSLSEPLLVDTLPALFDNIAEALTPDYPRTSAGVPATTVASEHGGERARMTNYDVAAVISEYQLLRSTLMDVLRQHDVPLTKEDLHTIGSSFDATVKEAVTAFALVQSAFRERFVNALMHDLRNPLGAISIAAELISHSNDLPTIHAHSSRINASVERMERMIHDLLDTVVFQRGERLRLHLSSINMLELVKDVCDEAAAVHGPRLSVLGESVKGWWDEDAIKRALENLIGNAVKYGASNTPITIKITSYHERVALSVHNEGQAIPPDQIESVFQVYQRAKLAKEGNKQGWGIGLPYVRSVGESHGGTIGVDSADERGTTFIIDMPIDARPYQNTPTLE
jgi:signal transduction histidine kinase